VHALVSELLDRGKTVLVETGGHRDISALDPRAKRIMDVKTPSSGESERNRWENLDDLREGDELKFVVKDRADFDYSLAVIERHRLEERVPLLFSPVHGELEPGVLADWILESGTRARMQVQLHKILRPGVVRGV
jgi:7-carboxy-7-deazaguanine synthase